MPTAPVMQEVVQPQMAQPQMKARFDPYTGKEVVQPQMVQPQMAQPQMAQPQMKGRFDPYTGKENPNFDPDESVQFL